MKYQTDENYKPLKLPRVVKWAPSVFLAGALTYAIISGFREGWKSVPVKGLEARVVQEAEVNEPFKQNKIVNIDNEFSYLKVYDNFINKYVSEFNKKHNIALDPNLIRVMIAVESGSEKDREMAFKYDPMQIANKGDFALEVLANEGEYVKFIGDFSRLKGKNKTSWNKEKKCWDYSKSNMDAESSIYGGIGWLLNKAAIIIEEGPITKYEVKKGDSLWKIAKENGSFQKVLEKYNPNIDYNKLQIGQKINFRKARVGFAQKVNWKEAVKRYNGGGDPNYVEKVYSVLKKLKEN